MMARLVAMMLALATTAVHGLRKAPSRARAAALSEESENMTLSMNASQYWSGIDLGSRSSIQARLKSTQRRISYRGLWDAFGTVFRNLPGGGCNGGLVWDVYSDKCWNFRTDQCGQYRKEGDCYNREHSWPKSWWGGQVNDAYSDLFHVIPSDGFVNGRRAAYWFGNVGVKTYTSSEGHKLGACSYGSGLGGVCFEPTPRVKGLLARAMFYFNLRYDGEIDADVRNAKVMRQWHEENPVTPLEREINNRIQSVQGNRNPFIDHPNSVATFFS